VTDPADGDKWHPDNRQGYLGHGVSRSQWPIHGGLAVLLVIAAAAGSHLWFLVPAAVLGGLADYERRMPRRRDRLRPVCLVGVGIQAWRTRARE
jgi:hypothetical protein